MKPLTLGDFPPELLRAYDDPDGDIMWRAGIARAANILLKRRGHVYKALEMLRDMIDGGEECRGRDQQISEVIRELEAVCA